MSTLTSKDFCLARPTSRVLSAPGGRSQISFGDYVEPKQEKVNKENISAPVVEKKIESAVAPTPVVQQAVQMQRVRQPPGGASSFSLGW